MAIVFILGFILLLSWFGVKVFWLFFLVGLLYIGWVIRFIRFFGLVYRDLWYVIKHGRGFGEYGCTIYCGRQGDGKTTAITQYLERMRLRYPRCLILTNYGYLHEDGVIEDWRDLLTIRNCTDGVIFAVDEIQNEYNSMAWKDFPESLLREITQQRKQRVKIVLSSQIFTRVVKQLREQCFDVIECKTLMGRWVFLKAFDAEEYNGIIDRPEAKQKLHRLWRYNFLQTDYLRSLFDSYRKVEKMRKTEFLPRDEK